MNDSKSENRLELDIQAVVQRAIAEFVQQDSVRREPALKAELQEERKRREALEKRLNLMAEENRKTREAAEQAERSAKIRSELQALGVTKIDLAYKAVQDEIQRTEDGRLVARRDQGDVSLREYLAEFVHENPEFLPARISGGTGIASGPRVSPTQAPVDIEHISPSMTKEAKERVRQEILRVASQNLRGM
jgi:hypothetical protein